jgi:hypothetical protein
MAAAATSIAGVAEGLQIVGTSIKAEPRQQAKHRNKAI